MGASRRQPAQAAAGECSLQAVQSRPPATDAKLPALRSLLYLCRSQFDTKDAAAFRIVFDPDAAAMRIHDGFADCQAQTYSLAGGSLASAKYLMKLQEHLLFVIVRNAVP